MTTWSQPSRVRWQPLWDHAKKHGLSDDAAQLYATLMWWGLGYGYPPADIESGYRSDDYQRQLRERWDRGDRRGLLVRPAESSPHTRRTGFDLKRVPHLHIYGAWAPYAGGRWGGNFRGEHAGDDVHFDTEA